MTASSRAAQAGFREPSDMNPPICHGWFQE